MIFLGIALLIIWAVEIVFYISVFIREYMTDVKRYGREEARKIWTGRR